MIGKCWFDVITQDTTTGNDVISARIYPDQDYGLIMVEYDAPPPTPKIYRVSIEGRDGTLDLSEWEGYQQVRYNDRNVSVKFRDMNSRANADLFVRKILGKKVYIHFDDDPDYYYRGRCESANVVTRQHVTNISLVIACNPFKYYVQYDYVEYTVTAGATKTASITIDCQNVIPIIEAEGVESGLTNNSAFNIIRGSETETYNITQDGVVNTSGAVFRTGNTSISIVNANTTDNLKVKIKWREEVL